MSVSGDIETANLSYDEVTGGVWLHCRDGLFALGPLGCCLDEVPSVLLEELKELATLVREAREYGRACEATARHADESRRDPIGWR